MTTPSAPARPIPEVGWRRWQVYLSTAGPEPLAPLRVSLPDMLSSRRALVAVLLLLMAAACHPEFQVTNYPTNEALYRAAMDEYAHGRWDNAVSALEKLTLLDPLTELLNRRGLQQAARAAGLQATRSIRAKRRAIFRR